MFEGKDYLDVILVAIQVQGANNSISEIIKETVSAMIAADREVMSAYAQLSSHLQGLQGKA